MALLQINSKCEDRMQDEYTIPVCGLFIVWETSFPYDKNAPRGSSCRHYVPGSAIRLTAT